MSKKASPFMSLAVIVGGDAFLWALIILVCRYVSHSSLVQ